MPSLALFGATGNTGKAVLALALEQGYVVRALVRSPEKVYSASAVLLSSMYTYQ